MLSERQESLLKNIIENHVETAQPVASSLLAGEFDVSSATIRNEMSELEKEGFIHSPHTSAGRVPTEKAYKYYIQNYLHAKSLQSSDAQRLEKAYDKDKQDRRNALRSIAKEMADVTGQTIIVSFAKNDVYYTGLTNLFSQPEFRDNDLIIRLSEIIDSLDAVMQKFYDEISKDMRIDVGSDNRFHEQCASIAARLRDESAVMLLLGPMRMDYSKNADAISLAQELSD